MKDRFHIQLAKRKRINSLGSQITSFALFFGCIFALFLLPAKYLPTEIATIYLLEFMHRNVYVCISFSTIIFLLGEGLRGMRSYEQAELGITSDQLIILSKTQSIKLEFKDIKKIKGILNLVRSLSNIHKLNFIIQTENRKQYEIRAHKDIFNALTDYFPNKSSKYG